MNSLSVISHTLKKNILTDFRAYPFSTFLQKMAAGFFGILFPIIIFHLLFDGKTSDAFTAAASTSDYVTYIVIGQLISSFGFATITTTGMATVREIHEGTFDQILLSPASRLGYFFGCYLEQLILSFIELIVMYIIGCLMGLKIDFSNIHYFLIAMAVISFSGLMCSFLVSSIFIFTRSVFLVENTLFYLIGLISGTYFPVSYFPKKVAALFSVLPITKSVNLVRRINSGNINWNIMLKECTSILLNSLPVFLIGYIWFRKYIENKLIEGIFS